MSNKVIDIDLDDADPNGIVTIAAIGAGGDLTLNGALVADGVAVMDYARQIGILSAADDGLVIFTITGTDETGRALVEAVTGSSGAPGTAESAGYFKTVTNINASAASAGNVTIGTVDEATSHPYPLNTYADAAAAINVNVTGTIDFTVQERFDDFQAVDLAIQDTTRWQTITAFSAKTADTTSTATRGASAVRVIINSHSAAAELQMYIAERTYTI